MTFQRITVNPHQMGGVPCLRGLRIPVATVVGMVADGMSDDELSKPFPTLPARTSARPCVTPPKRFVSAKSPW